MQSGSGHLSSHLSRRPRHKQVEEQSVGTVDNTSVSSHNTLCSCEEQPQSQPGPNGNKSKQSAALSNRSLGSGSGHGLGNSSHHSQRGIRRPWKRAPTRELEVSGANDNVEARDGKPSLRDSGSKVAGARRPVLFKQKGIRDLTTSTRGGLFGTQQQAQQTNIKDKQHQSLAQNTSIAQHTELHAGGIPKLRQLYLEQDQHNDHQLYLAKNTFSSSSEKQQESCSRREIAQNATPLDAAITAFVLDGI